MAFSIIIILLFMVGPFLLASWLIWIWASGRCLQFLIFAVPKQMIPQICDTQLLYLIVPTLIFVFGTGYALALWNDFNVIVEAKAAFKELRNRKK